MSEPAALPGLPAVLREWGRIGCIGFGGPPAHIALLRDLCVERKRWLAEEDFEDAIAATNRLPAPPPPSWRSSAPGRFADYRAPWWAGSRSSFQGWR